MHVSTVGVLNNHAFVSNRPPAVSQAGTGEAAERNQGPNDGDGDADDRGGSTRGINTRA